MLGAEPPKYKWFSARPIEPQFRPTPDESFNAAPKSAAEYAAGGSDPQL